MSVPPGTDGTDEMCHFDNKVLTGGGNIGQLLIKRARALSLLAETRSPQVHVQLCKGSCAACDIGALLSSLLLLVVLLLLLLL